MYLDVESTPKEFLRPKELGYTAAKMTPLVPADNNLVQPARMVREARAKVAAVRKAVGDDFDIAVDAHGRCTTTMAIDFCTRVEEYDLLWGEEPTQLEDLGELDLRATRLVCWRRRTGSIWRRLIRKARSAPWRPCTWVPPRPAQPFRNSRWIALPGSRNCLKAPVPKVVAGYAELPSRPGLGVTLHEKVAAQHPYKPTNRPEYKFPDGCVTDQ
jgi:galactonate dehydratase